jgi:PAS domain-containing protein
MADILDIVGFGANALAVLTTLTLVGMLWRQRHKPTARPFLWVSLTLCAASLGHIAHYQLNLLAPVLSPLLGPLGDFIGYEISVNEERTLWVALQMVRDGVMARFWFVFALRYTGRRGRLEQVIRWSLNVLVVSSVSLWSIYAVFSNPFVGIFGQLAQLMLEATLVAGGVMLLTMALRHAAFPLKQAGLLSGGVFALEVLQILTVSLDEPILVPISIIVPTLCFIAALSRYRVFDTLPVATTVGRNKIVESVGEGVLIVDRDQQLYDCNHSAADQLGIGESDAIGTSLLTLQPALPEPRRLSTVDGTIRVQIPDGPLLTVAASEIRNERDQLLGYTLVTRDVTDRYNREQRLALLNQLLADIAHDRMETVTREVTDITDDTPGNSRSDELGDWIWDTTTDLATLVARTREIEDTLASEAPQIGTGRTNVATTVREVVEEFWEQETEIVTTIPDNQRLATVDETLVEIATRTILEDAVGEPSNAVAVEVTRTGADGIGIRFDARVSPDSTADPSEAISELSVQVARLAVNCVGGDVDVEETAHTQLVWIRLPTESEQQRIVDSPPQSGGVWS